MLLQAHMDFHPQAAFWLDVADKAIKASAVLLGGIWTWINYRRSRTYAKRLDLQLSGSVFQKQDLYIEINVGLKNLGRVAILCSRKAPLVNSLRS